MKSFDWPGEPPPLLDDEMAWFDDAGWHVRHADGSVEDFPDLLAQRLAEAGIDLAKIK